MADVVKTRGEKITLREKSPVASGGSNVVEERGVQAAGWGFTAPVWES